MRRDSGGQDGDDGRSGDGDAQAVGDACRERVPTAEPDERVRRPRTRASVLSSRP